MQLFATKRPSLLNAKKPSFMFDPPVAESEETVRINFQGFPKDVSMQVLTSIDGSELQEMFTENFDRLMRDDKDRVQLNHELHVFDEVLKYLKSNRTFLT